MPYKADIVREGDLALEHYAPDREYRIKRSFLSIA